MEMSPFVGTGFYWRNSRKKDLILLIRMRVQLLLVQQLFIHTRHLLRRTSHEKHEKDHEVGRIYL